ncbi:hypothetical protein ACH46_16880 [Gordonia phthalatica]|uniref:Glycoside hydrolase family 5 domain-containing protein n=2 Tax=Gordonia phthalatica TaxID=1136941 RepID=A0A0N7FVF1_9ACTN|nr:hypothetical protein ACH46_16880 [Gordonia phthalatica]
MRSLGGTWIRVEMNWRTIEPVPGQQDWSAVDRVVAAATRHGLQVVGLLTAAPRWASDPNAGDALGSRPNRPDAFGSFSGAAADRYRATIRVWEIWNEPNIPIFFVPAPDVDLYAPLLKAAHIAIHAVRPDAIVLTAGTAAANDTAVTIAPTTFVNRLYRLGMAPYFEGVAMHPYTFPFTPQNDPNGNWDSVSDVRRIMVANGDEKKGIWLTEFGVPTGSSGDAMTEAQQSAILEDAIQTAGRMPFVYGPLLIYMIRDMGTDASWRENCFGVLRYDYSPKQSALMLRRIRPE